VLGVWLNLPLPNKKIALQTEIHYTGKGVKTVNNPIFQDSASKVNQGFNPYYKMSLHYIDVPFLLQYYNKRFVYELGTTIGFLAGGTIYDVNGVLASGAQGSPQDKPFNRIDWTTAIGIGFNISNHWMGNWRLSNSIVPIRTYAVNVARSNAFGGIGQYNTVMEFTLRYSFNVLSRKNETLTTTPIK
jgi:Outer membrane protein beta-barrel domain